ncbi:MAG: 1-acyl-sn-glycerol-3-phosphate acyltransferase, partial [Proteobacteria bacterium]|nr:1-acyl-sn-glycerol-3-phosphate acyltransferase [Pseudomonadota bacterium]
FKKGAFRMALDLGIPVVPISIHNTQKVLPSDTLDWRPGRVKLIFHEPVQVTPGNLNDIARETRQIIVDALESDSAG